MKTRKTLKALKTLENRKLSPWVTENLIPSCQNACPCILGPCVLDPTDVRSSLICVCTSVGMRSILVCMCSKTSLLDPKYSYARSWYWNASNFCLLSPIFNESLGFN
jgi:hypothetical protein